MKRLFMAITGLAVVSLLFTGCDQVSSSVDTEDAVSAGGAVNFRFLISDEKNDIEDFKHLYIVISSIGVREAGDSGQWITLDLKDDPDGDNIIGIDLRPLEDENALVLWSGNIDAGDYDKVFIHVDNVTGILADGGGTAEVKLPSGRLQISKPFTVGDEVANFVYDITVVKAGTSGKYILKPQIAESGADQEFNDVTPQGQTAQNQGQNKEQNGEQANQVEWFQGVITAIGGDDENGSPWTMTLEGIDGLVTVYLVELEGTPYVGARANIEGILTESTITGANAEIDEGVMY